LSVALLSADVLASAMPGARGRSSPRFAASGRIDSQKWGVMLGHCMALVQENAERMRRHSVDLPRTRTAMTICTASVPLLHHAASRQIPPHYINLLNINDYFIWHV
jgi:hypothetical protein